MASPAGLPGLRSPGVGFEQPFEMLEACHERVQRSLDLLSRLCAHVRAQGADDSAREAARDVLRYFDIAAPLHHEDEELHVFPPLLARAAASPANAASFDTADAADLVALVEQLRRDHTAMAAAWAEARVPLAALAAGGLAGFDASQEAAFDRFIALHTDHIRHEEGAAYPAARAVLAESTVQSMGREMARRRTVV